MENPNDTAWVNLQGIKTQDPNQRNLYPKRKEILSE